MIFFFSALAIRSAGSSGSGEGSVLARCGSERDLVRRRRPHRLLDCAPSRAAILSGVGAARHDLAVGGGPVHELRHETVARFRPGLRDAGHRPPFIPPGTGDARAHATGAPLRPRRHLPPGRHLHATGPDLAAAHGHPPDRTLRNQHCRVQDLPP